MNDIIQANQLTKIYPAMRGQASLCAVDRADFTVRSGEVFGFLGPNGAGKTTTIRMLTGLTRPTSGNACILDFDLLKDVTRIKKHMGVVPEASNLYDELTAFDNLIFNMQLYGVPHRERKARAEELLDLFHLTEKRDTPFAKLSRGMKRALTIAAALAHRPPLIFLDEPTTGLDVMSARGLRQMIAGLRQQGVTIFLTTHYLEEAERLCDRVAIIVKGHIVALDTVDGLKASHQQKTIIEVTLVDSNGQQEKKRFECEDGVEAAIRRLLIDTNGRRVMAVNTLRPSLEDVFVKLTGLNINVMLTEKGGKGGGGSVGG
jgi:ABC-2 type transport system ATP-binding protein